MVHDQVYVPLRKEFKTKTGSFWEDHPQYCMSLFQPVLLPALHRITIINAGTLYPGHASFQSIRITEFSAAVSQYIQTQRRTRRCPYAFPDDPK